MCLIDKRNEAVRGDGSGTECLRELISGIRPHADDVSYGMPRLAKDAAVFWAELVIADLVTQTIDLSLQVCTKVDHAQGGAADHLSAFTDVLMGDQA